MSQIPTTDLSGFDLNDAALCWLLADHITTKPNNDGKGDRLTAYALRRLASQIEAANVE